MDEIYLQNKILISKDLNLYYYNDNDEITYDVIDFRTPSFYLNKQIQLEDGFTLRNYFELIEKYELFQFLDTFFGNYLEEFNNCPSQDCKNTEINYIIINRHITYEDEHSFEPPKLLNEVEDLVTSEDGLIHIDKSITNELIVHGFNEKENTFYALDFNPLKDLLDYEIKIGETLLCINNDHSYNIQDTDINLFEFIKSIIYELSFHGSGEDRNLKKDELENLLTNFNE